VIDRVDVVEERAIELRRPIDLALTCGPLTRGRRDPSNRLTTDELWRATNTPHGTATIHVRLDPRGARARLRTWGDGAAWAMHHAPALIGLEDDAEFGSDHPVVRAAIDATRGLRMGAARAVLDVALPTVIDQRVTAVEAKRTWFGLVRRFGEVAPGPMPLLVPPAAAVIGALTDLDRRRHGLELRRGVAFTSVARHSDRLQRAADLDSATLQRMLLDLSGVGVWTAATVAQVVCGDADAVPIGDWHLPRIVGWALAGEARADDDLMLELLEPFRPHRGRVVRMLVAAGRGPDRIAPRAEIPDLLGREIRGERDYRVRRTLRFD
jgi:3-methyladenine DNA glycosylase/8-oxoguanine DNA glycosylase